MVKLQFTSAQQSYHKGSGGMWAHRPAGKPNFNQVMLLRARATYAGETVPVRSRWWAIHLETIPRYSSGEMFFTSGGLFLQFWASAPDSRKVIYAFLQLFYFKNKTLQCTQDVSQMSVTAKLNGGAQPPLGIWPLPSPVQLLQEAFHIWSHKHVPRLLWKQTVPSYHLGFGRSPEKVHCTRYCTPCTPNSPPPHPAGPWKMIFRIDKMWYKKRCLHIF